jgi:hypothetical protein
MPHATLWGSADWQFALDALEIAAKFYDGGPMALATELRHREKVMGTTFDYRRGCRIRYVPPESAAPVPVTALDDYRNL